MLGKTIWTGYRRLHESKPTISDLDSVATSNQVITFSRVNLIKVIFFAHHYTHLS